MNRRLSDVDHSVAHRMVQGLQNFCMVLVLVIFWTLLLDWMAKDVEKPDAHRHAPANFHGQEVEWHRQDAGPRNEEFTARD